MKKKLLILSALTFLSSLTISGCSFLDGIIDQFSTPTPSEPSVTPTNTPTPTKKDVELDLMAFDVNVTKHKFELNDAFVTPTCIATYSDGSTEDVTKKVKIEGADTSSLGEKEVTISYKSGIYTRLTKYNITVVARSDYHFDAGDDIKTLELVNVHHDYLVGDSFIMPTVYAIDKSDNKVDVTSSCVVSNYDMTRMGVYNVEINYLDHIVKYQIYVVDVEENNRYKMTELGFYLSDYDRTVVIGEHFPLNLIKKIEGKWEFETIGFGSSSSIEGTTYRSDNVDIVEITSDGLVIPKSIGTTYVYFSFPSTSGTYTFRCKVTVAEKELVDFTTQSIKTTYYSGQDINVKGNFIATYQTGYQENVIPSYDLSGVNSEVPGEYEITISYTLNGVTKSIKQTITILDSELYQLEKTDLAYDVDDFLINSSVPVTALPHSGTLKNIVVPVKFTDSDNYITNYDNVVNDIEKCFFSINDDDLTWMSVKEYYEQESFNQITYGGLVTDIYEASNTSTYYCEGTNLNKLKNDIVDWYFANNPSENPSDYDINDDGFLDGLNLVYLYPDYRSGDLGKDYSVLWAMVKSQLDGVPDVDKPIADKYFWTSYDFMYSSDSLAFARTGKSSVHAESDKSDKLSSRTFIHETGHMFGINDYYSYSEGVYFAGHANMQTLNLMGHDPYSMMLYSWAKPYIPEISSTITIGDFQKTHDVILLTPSWNILNSPFDEYFLIDLYVPESGLNYYDSQIRKPVFDNGGKINDLNVVGVRIWHVDARLGTKISNYEELTNDPTVSDGVEAIIDNTYEDELYQNYLNGVSNEGKYERYMELQLVRNKTNYDYKTATYLREDEYFLEGDKFDMDTFSSQFVNGNKMDNGLDLGWSIEIEGIYYDSVNGYTADIKVIKK